MGGLRYRVTFIRAEGGQGRPSAKRYNISQYSSMFTSDGTRNTKQRLRSLALCISFPRVICLSSSVCLSVSGCLSPLSLRVSVFL